MSTFEDLVQGLYQCGSYERGHIYLKEHSLQITPEFVSGLRGVSMGFLTREPPDPELALVFGDLTIVAALLLGNDGEKGIAYYCEGSILFRLGKLHEAVGFLNDAQAYLRSAGDRRQLANCLFDAANCLGQLGDYRSALGLLEEVLGCQDDEKDRTETQAFMLVLTQRSGGDINALLDRILLQSRKRKVRVRQAVDDEIRRRICEGLVSQCPMEKCDELFKNSIPTFAGNAEYRFFVAEDEKAAGKWPPYAYGLLKPYREPFNERDFLGLEAAWFSDAEIESHLDVIEEVRKLAADLNVYALCISEESIGSPSTFRAMLTELRLGGTPRILLEGARPGVYSAFTDSPKSGAFYASAMALRARPEQCDFAGQAISETIPLYRGEGRWSCRSKRARWDCADLPELCCHFFRHGFHGRAEGSFEGTIQAQILHQGYVDQPTVSLSESFDVCAYYATDQHRREEGGVVFQVDTRALLARACIYDSLGTLRRTCPWASGSSLDLIVKVMHVLDSERNDVRASGAFLGKFHEESRRRVESFGGGRTFGARMDWKVLLSAGELEKLASGGITTADLDLINEEFEAFWNVALGKMAAMETIHVDTGSTESQDLSRAYFVAFDQARLKLKEAWTLNRFSQHNHPGWDLSPFGYVAKTLRDREFFSTGDVPGNCICEAVIVDRTGRRKKVLANTAR